MLIFRESAEAAGTVACSWASATPRREPGWPKHGVLSAHGACSGMCGRRYGRGANEATVQEDVWCPGVDFNSLHKRWVAPDALSFNQNRHRSASSGSLPPVAPGELVKQRRRNQPASRLATSTVLDLRARVPSKAPGSDHN